MHDNDAPAGRTTVDLNKHDALAGAFPATSEGRLLFAIAFLFSMFQIATAAHFVDPPSQLVRAIHVGFVTVLIFPLLANMAGKLWRPLRRGRGIAYRAGSNRANCAASPISAFRAVSDDDKGAGCLSREDCG